MTEKPEQLTTQIDGTKYVKKALDQRAEQSQEDKACWAKDHPSKQPGENVKGKTHKSYTTQRFASSAYREGYTKIVWSR